MNLAKIAKVEETREKPIIQDLDIFLIIQTLIHVGPSNGLYVAKA
jgi:hypothetical protein